MKVIRGSKIIMKAQSLPTALDESQVSESILVKIVMLGDSRVGKTSLVKRYMRGRFEHNPKITLGLDLSFRVQIFDDIKVTIQLWDLGGQERFKTSRKRFYAGASAAVLVYDVSRPKTLKNLEDWLEELKENAGKVPIIVIGNKSDLNIKTDEIEETKWATDHNAVTYLRTSAKSGENVNHAFSLLTTEILEKWKNHH